MVRSLAGMIFCILLLLSCRKDPYNCETGIYSLRQPVYTSHPAGVLKLGDTLHLRFELPFRVFNRATGDTSDISRHEQIFQRVWMMSLFKDQYSQTGLNTTYTPNAFRSISPNVNIQALNHRGIHRGFSFYLKKGTNGFMADIYLLPVNRGLYAFSLRGGAIENVPCGAGVDAFYDNYDRVAGLELEEELLGRRLDSTSRRLSLEGTNNMTVKVI